MMRWFALVLVSALTFATYWFQDFFGGIKDLLGSEYGFSNEQFGRIISSTNIANMFGMIVLGGIMLDRWGVRLAGLVFGGLAALGGLIVYLAGVNAFGEASDVKLWTICLGRMLFGSGLEVVCVVVTRTIVKWFKGYELALAMAVNVGFGRCGTAMGIAVSPDIVGAGSVSPAVGFAASLLLLSLIMFVVYLFFDIRLDRQTARDIAESDEERFKISDLAKLAGNRAFICITLLCVAFYAAVFPFIQYAPDLLVNKFGFTRQLPDEGILAISGSQTLGTAAVYAGLFLFAICFSTIPPRLGSASKRFAGRLIMAGILAAAIFAMKDKLALWLLDGAKTTSLIPLGTIIFTPVFGNIVDKTGRAASLMILGAGLLIFSHLALSVFNSVTLGYAGLLSLGVAFSLVPAAMWPSVTKIVPENRLGTAYAAMFTFQNWGLGAFYWGIGAVLDWTNSDNLKAIEAGTTTYDYTVPILMLVVCGIVSVYLACKLLQADRKYGYGLEKPNENLSI
jgi:MFS family permease